MTRRHGDATAVETNAFDAKTDSASASEYFRYYGLIPQQQNMLQDAVRTGTYFTAILENSVDFKDKVVMDVGAGSGILSFFAAMALVLDDNTFARVLSSIQARKQRLLRKSSLRLKYFESIVCFAWMYFF